VRRGPAGPPKKRNRRRNGRGKGAAGAYQTQYKNRNVRRGNTNSNFGQRGIMKRLPSFTEQISQPLSAQVWALFKSYSINPGQSALFPVASVECQQWQKYRFRKFCIIYEPLVNEYNTNNDGAGEIIIGFDPDAGDQAPTSFSQAVNSKPIARGRPCDKIVLQIPPQLLKAQMDAHFVRHGSLPGGSDIKTYDIGLVNISVVGCGTTGTTTLGNIYFCYELDLMVQQIQLNTAAPANNQVSWFQSTTAQTYTTATPATAANATASANGLTIVNTAGSMVPPPGNYLVDFEGSFSDSVSEAQTVIMDFQKNAASVYAATLTRPTFGTVGVVLGAGDIISVSGSVIVSANGTDAFTQRVTYTGAAGVLTGGTSCRWTAV